MATNVGALSRDALPEHLAYRDNGCEIAPSCLRCPLPQCKYDDPRWFYRTQLERRDQQVVGAWRAEHLDVAVLAARFGISQRTVFRILQRGRGLAVRSNHRAAAALADALQGDRRGGDHGTELAPAVGPHGRGPA